MLRQFARSKICFRQAEVDGLRMKQANRAMLFVAAHSLASDPDFSRFPCVAVLYYPYNIRSASALFHIPHFHKNIIRHKSELFIAEK